MIKVLPPKTAEDVVARERERKARTTLLMALPVDHLAKFHKMADAKEMWEAIKFRFGGNDKSKKRQKYLLKQQFEGFFVSSSEGLHKGYDRSLPSSWSQVALIMRTKPRLDTLSFDDLYTYLRVFERDVKGTIASSSSNSHNVAFVSTDNTGSTNDVSTAYSISSPSVSKSQKEGFASYTNEVIHSFFANQLSSPQLDCNNLEQIDDDDLEEMDLKWQNASIAIKWGHFARDYRAKWNQDNRRIDRGYNGNKAKENSRRPASQDDSKALVTIDEEAVDWFGHVEEDTQNFAMMAYSSSNSGSGNKVQSCSKTCAESYARLKKLYDEQRYKLDDASVEITAYTLALKKKFFWPYFVDHSYDPSWSYGFRVVAAVFKMDRECDLANTLVNNRYAEGMHAVPLPKTGNYMPSGLDVEIDYSKFTYGPKHTSANESNSKSVDNASSDSDFSVETTTSMPAPVEDAPKVVNEPKVWTNAPIIEEYKSNSDDLVSNVQENIEKPSFAFTKPVKHVKYPRENVKETGTPNHSPKIKKQDRHSHTRKGLGYARKSCIVCGSFSHLIRDYDFHEKRMAKQVELTKSKEKAQRNTLATQKVNTVNTSLSVVKGYGDTVVKALAGCNWRNKRNNWNKVFKYNCGSKDDPHKALKDKGIVDSGCFKHMTGNKAHLADYQEFKGGSIAFGGSNGRITGKGTIKSGRLDFEDVYYVEELKPYNLFSVSQMCDKKNKVLFTDTDYLVLSPNFKLPGENQEANHSAGTQTNVDQGVNSEKINLHDEHFVLPIWSAYSTPVTSSGDKIGKNEKPDINTNNTNPLNSVSAPVSDVGPSRALNDDEPSYIDDPLMPHLEDIYASPTTWIFTNSSYDDEGVVTNFNNLETTVNVSPTPTTRIYTIHLKTQILGDPMNKKDERGFVVRNKACLVAQGHRQEEGIEYDEVFALVARNKAIRIFLAFVSYMGFIVYQMDVKSAFLYGTIDEEVYVTQPPGFVDLKFPNKVYKVVKALYGLHQAPRAWYATLSTFLERSRYRRGAIDKTLFIKQDKKDIMLVQVYVDDIIFGSTNKSWCDEFKELMKNSVKTASTPIETQKPLVKDEKAVDVDVHLYRFMIGSLMYLTASRPDIMFAIRACSRFQEIRNRRLSISWQETYFMAMKKQTIVATSTIEVEYVAAAHCYGQVLWIQNQLLDYGFNLMNTKIYIDNESTICIVKNLVFHLKTKYIEIRHHFIRDAYEKKLIQVLKIHTDDNVADLLTKVFNVSSKELDSPKQTALGVNTPRCDEDSLELKELMVFFVQFVLRKMELELLLCLSAKTTSCNEFSITMASVIICLATNQKFNFSRYILQSIVKNLEAGVPFYMFSRFVQLLVDNQLEDISHHHDIYENPSLTKKVFANMKRLGIGFSGVITLLFESMLVQAAEDVGEAQDDVYIPTKPSTSKPLKKHKSKKQQPKVPKAPSLVPSPEHQLPSPSTDPISTDQDKSEVIDLKSSFTHKIAKLEDRVDQLKKENKALKEKSFKTTQVDTAAPIENMEKSFKHGRMIVDMKEDVEEAQVYNLDLQHAKKVLIMQDTGEEEPAEMEKVFEVVKAAKLITEVVTTAQPTTTAAQVPKPSALRRKRGVIIQDPEETATSVIDNTVMRYHALKRKLVTEAQARKNMMVYLKNMVGFKMDFFKGMTYSEIRPIFEKHYNSIQAFLEKREEEVTVQEEGNKREGETLEQDIAKKQRIDEEAEELKTHL
nr:copia protein [Tanacetum cinerariifolium]